MSQIREILRKQNHWFQETFWGKAGSSLYNESSQITSTHIMVNIDRFSGTCQNPHHWMEVVSWGGGRGPSLRGLKRILKKIKLLNHTLLVHCRLFSVSGWFGAVLFLFFLIFFLLPLLVSKYNLPAVSERRINFAAKIFLLSTILFVMIQLLNIELTREADL